MYRICLCLALVCAVAASCWPDKKKDDEEIHIFHLGDYGSELGKKTKPNDIVTLRIQDRRKRETQVLKPPKSCKDDKECPMGVKCDKKQLKCNKAPAANTGSSGAAAPPAKKT